MQKINYVLTYFLIICLFSVSFHNPVKAEYIESQVLQISTGTKYHIEMHTDQYLMWNSEFHIDIRITITQFSKFTSEVKLFDFGLMLNNSSSLVGITTVTWYFRNQSLNSVNNYDQFESNIRTPIRYNQDFQDTIYFLGIVRLLEHDIMYRSIVFEIGSIRVFEEYPSVDYLVLNVAWLGLMIMPLVFGLLSGGSKLR